MRLVDVNLLLYASFNVFHEHHKARTWLDERLNSPERLGFAWDSLLAFVRLASNPRVLQPCISVGEAWQQVTSWLALENVWIPTPTPQHEKILGQIVAETRLTSNLIADAHLAALAISYGLILCSADTDFARFRGLRSENPIAL